MFIILIYMEQMFHAPSAASALHSDLQFIKKLQTYHDTKKHSRKNWELDYFFTEKSRELFENSHLFSHVNVCYPNHDS